MMRRIMKYFFWFEKSPGFCGIRFDVRGKFQGRLRKRKYNMRIGRMCMHTLKINIDYSYRQSFTRFGIFSIKVWVAFNRRVSG